ncbi:hypothetical protein [Streptomyces sp. OP7]|uniref:hypothetical protein n=1 Tax=Streptomyces sp. OP7 TaxID=3142462 RepID=UPI0032E92483
MGHRAAGSPGFWGRGVGPGVLFGGLTSVVSVAVIGRAWAACDVGSGSAANSVTLLFLAPLVWVAAGIPCGTLYGALARRGRGTALTAGVLLALSFTWLLVTWLGMPDDYPAPYCPGNVPPWWPVFLPG